MAAFRIHVEDLFQNFKRANFNNFESLSNDLNDSVGMRYHTAKIGDKYIELKKV